MSNADYVACERIHWVVLISQFTDTVCVSHRSKTPLNSLYSWEDLQRLESYSGIHVHSLIKRAVKVSIESNHKSIELFINYSSLYSIQPQCPPKVTSQQVHLTSKTSLNI